MYLLRSLVFISLFYLTVAHAVDIFPIQNYSQNVDQFLAPENHDYSRPLMDKEYQLTAMHHFYNHYYSSNSNGLSPWNPEMAQKLIPLITKMETEILNDFDNQNKPEEKLHYQENFQLRPNEWLQKVQYNMNFSQLSRLAYEKNKRAITIQNTYARALPETSPDFYHFTLPGQGFPFDNLQESAIWAGTPLYVFSQSKDKAWSLVLTPDAYIAWIRSQDLAMASQDFIEQWQNAAKKGLMAVIQTGTTALDEKHQFLATLYIGSVFPKGTANNRLLFPIKNMANQAVIKNIEIDKQAIAPMPLALTKKNMAKLLKELQNRPYGWGGIFFYNDCSQEMKSLFAPFGIWLPRNSAKQTQVASSLDLSENTINERLQILEQKGAPLMTLIYVGGHVMLYMGTYDKTPFSYQNIWGLASHARDKRYVIGKSVLLPLLKYYPENSEVHPQAGKPLFKMVLLNNIPANEDSPQTFIDNFLFTG